MSDTTHIKSFANYVGAAYVFQNHESGEKKTVNVAKATTKSESMEIPVCNSSSDFNNGDSITVTTNNAVQWSVWQHKDTDGDFVRCSASGYVPGAAPKIPGEYSAGGAKGLSVMTDGTLMMTTYSS